MDGHEINRVAYVGLDFHTLYDEQIARLQSQFGSVFTNFSVSELGVLLTDMACYGLDGLAFYLDRRVSDYYLSTSRTTRACTRLTRQLGYKMRSAVASSVTAYIAITSSFGAPVTLPAGRQLQGPDDLVYTTAKDLVFNPGDGEKTVLSYEGLPVTETFVSSGDPDQVLELRQIGDGRYLLGGTVQVLVNGAAWTEERFLTFELTDQYEVSYADDPPTVRFGNGLAGNIPPVGATISVSYMASKGRAGQILEGQLLGLNGVLTSGGVPLTVTVRNVDRSTPGDDPETVEEAQRMAPQVSKAGDGAVTRPDYVAHANAYADPLVGRVATARALSVRTASRDLYLNNQIALINTYVGLLPTAVSPQVASARTALDTARTALATVLTELTALVADTAAADASLVTARGLHLGTQTNRATVGVENTEVGTQSAALAAAINALPGGGADALTVGTRGALLAYTSRITALVGEIATVLGTMGTDLTSELTSLDAARTSLAAAGLALTAPPTSHAASAATARATAATAVGDPSPATGVYAPVAQIEALVVTAATSYVAVVTGATTAIYNHIDQLLADDGYANLISVPILARDPDGYYVAPSVSLIQSLQAHLDARREETQTVEVVDGSEALVRPVIVARVGVRVGISLEVTQVAAAAAIASLLRGREFGESLYLSDLHDALLALDGVAFCNVTITGHRVTVGSSTTVSTALLDASGNLVLDAGQVLTKDTRSTLPDPITVTAEVFTPA